MNCVLMQLVVSIQHTNYFHNVWSDLKSIVTQGRSFCSSSLDIQKVACIIDVRFIT